MGYRRLRLRKQRRGALLLEVLLAIVIMSVSLGVIIQAMTTSLRAARFAAQYTQAVVAGDNEMTKVIRETRFADSGAIDFREADEESVYTFSVENESSVETSDLDVLRLHIEWDTGGKSKKLELATYMRTATP